MIKSLKTNKKLYLSLFKAVVPGVLFLIVLFSMFFISSNDKVITSLAKVFYGDNEVELDNWEISTVFYDSTVNDGKTPLTEINWDAFDGGYEEGETRVITVQINYKNTNTVTTYALNSLKIIIPNLVYQYKNANLQANINISANDNTHVGFDWNLVSTNLLSSENFVFTNNIVYEEKTNFEGAIQIVYTLTPAKEVNATSGDYIIEKYDEECTHELQKSIKSKLSNNSNNTIDIVESNEISFSYSRTYHHEWTRIQYDIYKRIDSKVNEYDMFGEHPEDYIWIRYDEHYQEKSNQVELLVSVKSGTYEMREYLVEGTKMYNLQGEEIECPNNICTLTSTSNGYSFYVAYPKSIYNSENNNMNVDNHSELWGVYDDDTEVELIQTKDYPINLNNYIFNEGMYSFSKKKSGETDNKLYYQGLKNKTKTTAKFNFSGKVYYRGKKFSTIVGDDIIVVKDGDNYRKLQDTEYSFKSVTNQTFASLEDDMKIELWVRYQGETDYVLYTDDIQGYKSITFEDDENVVGWYFKYKNYHKSENSMYAYTTVDFKNEIENTEGVYYNYGYNIVYLEENGNYNPINYAQEYSGSDPGMQIVSDYELQTYGVNYSRMSAPITWSYLDTKNRNELHTVKINSGEIVQDAENEKFNGNYRVGIQLWGNGEDYNVYSNYYQYFDESAILKGYKIYDLLPEGMELESTKEEIINSIAFTMSRKYYAYDGSSYTSRDIPSYHAVMKLNDNSRLGYRQIIQFFKDNSSVQVIKDWNNTGRTMIIITADVTDEKLVFFGFGGYTDYYMGFDYTIKYSLSYDSYVEYGSVWKNDAFAEFLNPNQYQTFLSSSKVKDDGMVNDGIGDINNNNSEEDYLSKASATDTVVFSFAASQDLQVTVKTGDESFDSEKANVDYKNEYYYKLRVRTGVNDITNLIIYDSLEDYTKDPNMSNILASGGRKSWQGEFLGIDTSYAESKGYTIRTYYSENNQPGSIHSDDSWQLYTESVDKSKVKSLAFEYLDSNGNPAIIPTNSITYVLIKMKSPDDETIKTFAYNGCWTEWNAIDPITGQTVDFVTGINSNIVRVGLPNSVEPVDIDLNIDKYWVDNNNQSFRPDTINIQVVPNGDVTKAINVPLGSTNVDSTNPLHWSTTISVPKYDEDGEVINYSLREGEIILEDGYKYTPSIEGNTITNTLMKEIELKKIWKDNTNSYLTRPTNVTYMVKQNGNDYKEVTFTGDYNTNLWSKKLTVPVFDTSNNEYVYTVEEYNVDNYSGNCSELVCTNTLSGNKNISITKEWNDKDNEYSTRPDSIKVNLLRNGNLYQEVTINNTNWKSNNIEVPIYDENGVKYNYTISEDNVDEYGLVEYNQENFKITNSLKKKINLVIKKIWVDDNNSNNTRPSELQITLLRNNEEYQTVTLTGDTNEWTTSVEVDKYDNDFNKYKYSIKEVNDSISDLYNNVTYSEDELTVTNTLGEITNLTISKKWIDHDNEYLTRPDSIKVNLLQDGVMYREVTISKDKEWKEVINNIPVYDSNQNRHIYTIEESVTIPKYSKITYDQTNLEVTNELTEVPTVSLYFTVVNGYVDPITGEMKYDDFGLNEIMKKYNVKAEDEYIFTFELKNLDSGKIYDGNLSTQGILEFKDIPYGEYKAVEGEDKLFDFVDMLSIEEVNGVSFRREGNEGYISIRPTGENIVFGAKIVNKITPPIDNPNTGIFIELLILFIMLLPIIYSLYLLSYRIKSQ